MPVTTVNEAATTAASCRRQKNSRSSEVEGMQTFDAELERMVRAGILDMKTAMSYATNAGNLRLEMADLDETPVGV